MSDKDEITLKEAAEYLPRPVRAAGRRWYAHEDDPAAKREREIGNAGATLDAMLFASRAGKGVEGQR